VLGASVGSILAIFSREFIGLIGLAFLIATPGAIRVMSKWLQTFSYHVRIGWWLSLLIAWVTIGLKAFGRCRPIRSRA
jgi:putative ABC transport system permease protein